MVESQEQALRRLVSTLSGAEPKDLSTHLVGALDSKRYFQGTTIRALSQDFAPIASGLLVPMHLAQPPEPIDLVMVYTTLNELRDTPVPPEDFLETLETLHVGDVLLFVAGWLNRHRSGASLVELDREYLQILPPELAARAKTLLASPDMRKHLIAPQQLVALASLALAVCPSQPEQPHPAPEAVLPLLPLAVGDLLVAHSDELSDEESGERLRREMVSNHIFYSPKTMPHLIARWFRTWYEFPMIDEAVPDDYLIALYREATRVDLLDLATMTLAMWQSAGDGTYRTIDSSLTDLGIAEDRVDVTLGAIAGTPLQVLMAMAESPPTSWNSDVLRRFPALRWGDGSTVVIDRSFLIERVYGWLPYWDVHNHLKTQGDKKRTGLFGTTLRGYAERYAIEAITSMAGSGRVFPETTLQQAYGGKGIKIIDCAIAYPDTWVVLDVCTHAPKRETVHGRDPGALAEDIDKLVITKARQLQSTINQLRANESKLTGHPSGAPKVFAPVVLATEGFPVNPITTAMIREELVALDLLTASDILPLQILDLEEVEMIEGLQEVGGPSLATLLRDKPRGGFAGSAMRDYLLVERQEQVEIPTRVRDLARRAIAHLVQRIPKPTSPD
ncbi:hypothetical protein [Oerskovia paurometabola]|uniref:Helicase XPB/Ssl2 N-terminal domain-containing protein n=1 Tax=Oerskovia paurometabola TaxID=162170 RepID=A0ABW1XIK0_9CELL|nr:hypothetical protein [Oerskovia paurometabola]MBM7497347.1 hypothetical protein [Oerskovia paurometabola]